MAVIEVCDICEKKIAHSDGITIRCSDLKGDGVVGLEWRQNARERIYDIRICDRCISKIKKYCKKRGVMEDLFQ